MVMRNNGSLERFRNRREALIWLQGRGQISQGKFYGDCAAGLLTIYPDKTLSKFMVAEYADKVFGFARQEPPRKQILKKYARSRKAQEVLSESGQGEGMDTNRGEPTL